MKPDFKQQALDTVEYLRQEAMTNGPTQDKVAETTGFDRGNVNRMLNGRYIPRLDNFMRLCDAIGFKIKIVKK